MIWDIPSQVIFESTKISQDLGSVALHKSIESIDWINHNTRLSRNYRIFSEIFYF